MPTQHPLFGALEAASVQPGFSFLSFLNALESYLLTLGKQAIDTPEERASIEAAIQAGFDKFVAPLMRPIAAAVVRKNLMAFIDDMLTQLARA